MNLVDPFLIECVTLALCGPFLICKSDIMSHYFGHVSESDAQQEHASESLQIISEEEVHAVDDVVSKESSLLDEILADKEKSMLVDDDKSAGEQKPKQVTITQAGNPSVLFQG